MNIAVKYDTASMNAPSDEVAVTYDVMTERPVDTRVAVAYPTQGMGDVGAQGWATWILALGAAGAFGLGFWFARRCPLGSR